MRVELQPLPIRIFHWVLAGCVFILIGTGLLLNEPAAVLQLPFRQLRQIHVFFGFLLLVNFLAHVYYYFFTKRFTEILILPRDWGNVPSFLRYMFFITEEHPNYGRYNSGQKTVFTLWGVAQMLAGISGLLLLFPNSALWLQRLMGGLQNTRVLHFAIAIYFIMSVPLHLYLVFFENPAKLQSIFTGYVKKQPPPG